MIFYKRYVERYLPFLLLRLLDDAYLLSEGLSLIQPDQVMSNSKFQTFITSNYNLWTPLCSHAIVAVVNIMG
jgi:hypothetical protein